MRSLANIAVWAMWFFTLLMGLVSSSVCLAETLFVPDPNYPNIQSAIILAQDGDTIIIAPGIYTGIFNRDISFENKAITVRSEDPNDPNVVMATIIDAAGSEGDEHRGFIFDSGEDANSVLEGVTIINGYAISGGGIRCINSSPTIRYCIVSNNTSTGNGGGGIYLETSEAQIFNCTINGNMALDSDGGGVGCLDSHSVLLENCRIYDNFAEGQSRGGGIYCDNSILEVCRSRIYANRSILGGGVYCFDGSILTISNSEILGNSANGGGGIYNQDSTVTLKNCTLSSNQAFNGFGGALRGFSQGSFTLNNSILWANHAALPDDGSGNEIALTPTNNEMIELTIGYSDLQGGQENIVSVMDSGNVSLDWMAGNIDLDPLFIEQGSIDDKGTPGDLDDDIWVEGDYHLRVVSPAIDRGDPNSDFENEPLPNGDRVNLGAFGHTSEAALSIPRSPITLTKGSVKGDKKRLVYPLFDTLKLKGLLYASIEDAKIEDFLSADAVTILIYVVDENDLPTTNILLDTFEIEYDPNKVAAREKFRYKRPRENNGAIAQFKINYTKNFFSLHAKRVDLTGLRFPFKVEVAFGDYLGDIVIRDIDDLASRKGPPLRLLLGVSDELEIARAKVRTTRSGDSLTAKGNITMESANLVPPVGELEAFAQYLDLTKEEITVLWDGDEIEVLEMGSFEEISVGRFRYPKRRTAPEGIIRKLDLDFNKCRFKLSVKGAEPLTSVGSVALEIFATSGNFDAVGVVEMAP